MTPFSTLFIFKNPLLFTYYTTLKILNDKLIITTIFLVFFSNIYSQDVYYKLPEIKSNCPTIIINNNIISNENFIKKNEELITEMYVMKDKPNRKNHKFYNLSENGVLLINLNKKIKTKTQCQLNRFFGISKKNDVYVNGYLIEHPEYKIASESIIEIEIITPNSKNKLKSKSINVWTVTKKEREDGCQK